MADENQSRNGEPVPTRAPRRSAASNKAWQTLMPHHKKTADELMEEEEEEQETAASSPPVSLTRAASSRGVKATLPTKGPSAMLTAPVKNPLPRGAPMTTSPGTALKIVPAKASTVASSSHLQQQQRGPSDEEELEEASSELFPKPPEAAKPAKKRGRPAKNGGGGGGGDGSIGGGSSRGSTTGSLGKKMKLDNADDFAMDDYDDEDEADFGLPPMLNRQSAVYQTPRRACSPTCTKRCCLTEDGKRVSRQSTTGVRSDQYDPPYNARPSGKRKPRTPKTPAVTAVDKKSRGPYKKNPEMRLMTGGAAGGGGGGHYGSSAPGARSMQAVGMGRPVSAMPIRPSTQLMTGVGGSGGMASRVVTIGPGGKVQAVSRSSLASPSMSMVSRPRVAGGGVTGMSASAAGGIPRYPVAVAPSHQSGARLPGPQELLRAENSVDEQYRQARNTFTRHVVSGSSVAEFNRVIDLLTVENKRLIAAQTEDQEYVDGLNRKIRSLENSVTSLQRQLGVTTKAYHGALLEVNAERGGGVAGLAAAAVPSRQPMGGLSSAAGAASLKLIKKDEHADDSDHKPKEEEEEEGEGEEEEKTMAATTSVATVAPTATNVAAAPATTTTSTAGRVVPRLMEQQQEARGGAAAAMMVNRQQWMDDFDEEEEEMYDNMEEIEEEMAYFDEEEEDEDNMGLD